jgi:integrase/recombinase XerC
MDRMADKTAASIEAFCRFRALSLSPVTCGNDASRLKRFFRCLPETKRDYETVTGEDIGSYLTSLRGEQDYKAQCALSLKKYYGYLHDKRLVAADPTDRIDVPFPKRKSLVMAPPVKKIKKILRLLERNRTPSGVRNRLLVELAYGSGLRRAELSRLDIEDVNLTDRTAHVLGKGGKERVVPLSRRCCVILKEYTRNGAMPRGPLFVSKYGQRLMPSGIGGIIKRLTGLNPHRYRHACATHLLLNGCNIRHIQELLGHSSVTTTMGYTKLEKKDLQRVINRKHPGRLGIKALRNESSCNQ